MRTIANIIWVVLGGFVLSIGYFLVGLLSCLLIVTIPVGIAFFRMGRYVLWPFGKKVVPNPNAGFGTKIINIIWFLLFGWALALGHVMAALGQALTIIGLANAMVSIKMIPVSCFPFGKQIVAS